MTISREKFIIKSNKIHNNKYDYSQFVFKNMKSKSIVICKDHGAFEVLASNHIRKDHIYGCQICSGNKFTTSIFIEKANKIHNFKYDYALVDYKNTRTKVAINCLKKEHGIFWQKPNSHLGGTGCPVCKTRTKSEFIHDANIKHNFKYNYDNINYINTHNKIEIICGIDGHGMFLQTPHDHLRGNGCPVCNLHKLKTNEQFIKDANITHQNKYDYSKTNYINVKLKIDIICPITNHGLFSQTPNSHLRGAGCPKCAGKLSFEEFETLAYYKHKNKYKYYKCNFINLTTKTKITCLIHGNFYQRPDKHLSGNSCPRCVINISKPETLWLNQLNIPLENRNIGIKIPQQKRKLNVDGFEPITNTVYYFHGTFWHGHPDFYNQNAKHPISKKTFGELYQKTLKNEELLRNAGYNVVIMWEHDFQPKKFKNKE